MINTVEKIYQNKSFSYKVIYKDGTEWSVPHVTDNTDYQEILAWVAAGNTVTDPGE